jgi:hypothetical protein
LKLARFSAELAKKTALEKYHMKIPSDCLGSRNFIGGVGGHPLLSHNLIHNTDAEPPMRKVDAEPKV